MMRPLRVVSALAVAILAGRAVADETAVFVTNGAVRFASESIDDVLAREHNHPTAQGSQPPLTPGHEATFDQEKAAANTRAHGNGNLGGGGGGGGADNHGRVTGDDGDGSTAHGGHPGNGDQHGHWNHPDDGGIGPGPLINFQNPGSCGCEPPDPELTVGPSHVLTAINDNLRAFTKAGATVWTTSWESFFASINPAGSGSFASDPKVMYDAGSQRYFAVVLMINSAGNHSWWMLAASQSSNITSSTVWNKWAIDPDVADPGKFADYPGFGFDDSAIYITSNMFNGPTVDLAVIPKAQLIQASPPASPTFTQLVNVTTAAGTTAFTLQPARMYGAGAGFLASVRGAASNALYIYRVNNPTTSPTLTKATVSVSSYAVPPDATQQGTTNLIATGDTRLYDVVWRNNKLYANHTIANGSGTQARWYEVNTTSWPSVSLLQSGNVNAAGANYCYPSIAVDMNDNVAMGFTRCSGTEYPSGYHTYRGSGDPAGTMATPVLDHAGLGGYTGTRWGDYSGTAIDPADNLTFWTMQEYGASSGSGGSWSNWVTSFSVSTVCVAPSITTNPGQRIVCAGGSATFTVAASGSDPLTYQWRKDTVNLGGTNSSSLTISPASVNDAGSYDCVITNSCGSATSNPANLIVNFPASFSQQPSNAAVCGDGTVTFTIAASSQPAPTYAWEVESPPLNSNVWNPMFDGPISVNGVSVGSVTGSDQPSLQFQHDPTSNQFLRFQCVVQSACGNVASAPATLTVNSADFNGDGAVGTDADIEAFFACISGVCCPTCGSADFNGDGATGTDADIESFFRVLGGGSC
jgi:hypothetical protein